MKHQNESLLKNRLVEPLVKEADKITFLFIASRKTARNDD
jgi:hypothetical protein